MKIVVKTLACFVLIALLLAPATLSAQGDGWTAPASVSVRPFLGVGFGFDPGTTLGLEAAVPVTPNLEIRAEYSYWEPGPSVSCVLIDTYPCAVHGGAVLTGLRVSGPHFWRITPSAQASVGAFARDELIGVSSLAAGFGAGARIRVTAPLAVALTARYLRAFDDYYEALYPRDGLDFFAVALGLQYRFGR